MNISKESEETDGRNEIHQLIAKNYLVYCNNLKKHDNQLKIDKCLDKMIRVHQKIDITSLFQS